MIAGLRREVAAAALPQFTMRRKGKKMGKPKVPNTVSDKQRASLARRAREPAGGPFGQKAIAQRKASEQQRRKAGQN